MRKTIIHVDFANINRSAQEAGINLDYKDVLTYLSYDYDVRENVIHLGVNPVDISCAEELIEYLATAGWLVKPKTGIVTGRTFKASVVGDIYLDCMHARLINDADMLILCSGDSEYIPLVKYLRNYAGVYVCVAAFKNTCSTELAVEANTFIDLQIYFDDFTKRKAKENGADSDDVTDAEYTIE